MINAAIFTFYFFSSLFIVADTEPVDRRLEVNLQASEMIAELIEHSSRVPAQHELVGNWGCILFNAKNSLQGAGAYPQKQVFSFTKNGDQAVIEESHYNVYSATHLGWTLSKESVTSEAKDSCSLNVRKNTDANELLMSFSCKKEEPISNFVRYGVEDSNVQVLRYAICRSLDEVAL